MKIAFFDSGIGGLTVLKEAFSLLPYEDYIYFSDARYAPYGARPQQEVECLIADAIDFLAHQDIDALVIACHTASRLMKEKLQAKYDFPIIGMETGLDDSLFQNNEKSILVTGTNLSVKAWKQYFQGQNVRADYCSLQELIVFAEKLEFDTKQVSDYLTQKLEQYDWQAFQAILLGCTHFPFFRPQFQAILPNDVQIIDGSLATIQKLATLVSPSEARPTTIEYFISKTSQSTTLLHPYFELLNIPQTNPTTTLSPTPIATPNPFLLASSDHL